MRILAFSIHQAPTSTHADDLFSLQQTIISLSSHNSLNEQRLRVLDERLLANERLSIHAECRIEVGDEILRVLEADRESNHLRWHTCELLGLGVELRVRRRRRVDNERLGVTDIRNMREDGEALDQLLARLKTSCTPKTTMEPPFPLR